MLATGDLVTVAPHVLPDLKVRCGRFHGRVECPARVTPGVVWVQQMRPAGGTWNPGVHVAVRVDQLGPLELQIDLFGNPSDQAKRTTARYPRSAGGIDA